MLHFAAQKQGPEIPTGSTADNSAPEEEEEEEAGREAETRPRNSRDTTDREAAWDRARAAAGPKEKRESTAGVSWVGWYAEIQMEASGKTAGVTSLP